MLSTVVVLRPYSKQQEAGGGCQARELLRRINDRCVVRQ